MTFSARCWCGNTALEPFSEDYLRCPQCETLVLAHPPVGDLIPSPGAEQAYYGKEYWFSHQEQDLGLPNILARARTDLVDRIPYWLEKVLRHRLPPGRAIELGCSHGGFAAMLGAAGFDAAGLEVSPWIVDFARQAFSIPVFQGPLEQQPIPEGTYDLVALMDVLEHLADPLETLRSVARILSPGGLVAIQTPAYPAGKSLDELKASSAPFLDMLLPGEHLYLFSSQSLQRILSSTGFGYFLFEPALYPYDQFIFASAQPVPQYSMEEVDRALEQGKGGRLSQALIDLYQRLQLAEQRFQQADQDRSGRLEHMNTLERLLQESEADRAARLEQLNRLTSLLQESETDRAARLEQMNRLASLLQESEADRAARLERMNELDGKIKELDINLSTSYKKVTSLEQERASLTNQVAGTQKAIVDLQGTFFYRAMRRLGRTKSFEAALAAIPQPNATHPLRRIAVDLTPVRPGGENGGAKLVALELVRRLSRDLAPEIEYILFTSSDSHEELSCLDHPNVRRMCVNQVEGPASQAPSSSTVPAGSLPPGRPLWRRFTRQAGRLLETTLPAGTYRKIYSLFHEQVNAPRINNLVRSLSVDLVFCPFTAVYYYAPEVPVVVIAHDLQFLYYPQFFSPEQNYHTSRNLQQVCKVATRIICVSEYTRQTVLEAGKVEPERAVTIPSTVISPLAAQPEEKAAAVFGEYHLTAGDYLFFPANFWRHKNHTMLLTAFYQYCRKHPESRLKLVFSGAPGPRMQFLQEAVERMQLAGRVVFTGFVGLETLAALYQGCLAVIFPSLFEGFGIPVLEGMHFNKPVLCSNLTSLPEIGGEAVLYFDPRRPEEIVQAIERIVDDPSLVNELTRKGAQQASRFATPEQWAQQYLAVFKETTRAGRFIQNAVVGMFPDRWIGSNLEISIRPDPGIRQLELQLNVPPWFPHEKVNIQFTGSSLGQAKSFNLARGQNHTLSLPLLSQGGEIEALINATSSPKEAGINDDARQLSCTILSCRIISDGQTIDLV